MNMKHNYLLLLFVLSWVSHAHVNDAQAELVVPSIFSEHMVLQRAAKVPVWGTADSGAQVTVAFAEQTVQATADAKGDWKVELEPLKASKQPRTMSISAGGQKKTIGDVLVGEVWVGSGQSNMAGRVNSYAKNDKTLAKLVKQAPFTNIRLMQGGPKPSWKTANANSVAGFSAILFAFGERLQRDLDVPVGLIVGAVGGTPSGAWIPPQTFAKSQKIKHAIDAASKTWNKEQVEKQYLAKLAVWEKRAAEAKAEGKRVRGRKPSPPKGPGSSSRGGKIGGLYERYIQSSVGFRIQGVLWDQGEARSGVVGVDQYTVMSELIHGWRDAWRQGNFSFVFVQKPSGGGTAFAQENSITRNGDKFSAAPVNANPASLRGDDRYLYVRLMNDNANAWMVPASDLGSGIHPTNKWGYGNRAAEVALSQTYKTGQPAYGPKYRSHATKGKVITVAFDHIGKGLTVAHSEKVQGFAIAGADGQWQWADAKINGDTVEVWSDKVEQPKRIRYAFAAKIPWANLFNKDGLPALTFEAGE